MCVFTDVHHFCWYIRILVAFFHVLYTNFKGVVACTWRYNQRSLYLELSMKNMVSASRLNMYMMVDCLLFPCMSAVMCAIVMIPEYGAFGYYIRVYVL